MAGIYLRAIKVHAMHTTSCEVLEKSSEAASKSSSDKKSLSAVTIPSALSRLWNQMTMVMIVWVEDLGVVRVSTKHGMMVEVLDE